MNYVAKIAGLGLLLMVTLGLRAQELTKSGLDRKLFQTESGNDYTDLFTLTNAQGMEVCVTNYGGRVVSIWAPDKQGKFADVVCGFPTIEEYMRLKQNFGAAIGRYISRILGARFELDGVEYQLQGTKHCAHGGNPGFAQKIWRPLPVDNHTLKLYYLSADGENGFPGNLQVCLTYQLTDDNTLHVYYEATTDKPTVVNLSHHSFFAITGNPSQTVDREWLQVDADYITAYDDEKCVTGELYPVKDTPFDFNEAHRIGDGLQVDNHQLKITKGYDHTFVLNTGGDDRLPAVKLTDEESGRTLTVYTTEPGVQVYSGNGLNGKVRGKGDIYYSQRSAICFEAMHFADSPNKPLFPSTVLRPGETYYTHTAYAFGVVGK